MADIDYFAYGSNLHPLRLTERVPNARVIAPHRLRGYTLVFHKMGQDGSGKCDVIHTGATSDAVWGVVYRMDTTGKTILDQIEGLGYRAVRFGGLLDAYTYQARPEHVDRSLVPFEWYLDLVLSGARYHGLPDPYVRAIQQQRAVSDPDGARAARHSRLLQRMGRGT